MVTKKRNPQDATRAHDVAPLRRRIEKLEEESRKTKEILHTQGTWIQDFSERFEYFLTHGRTTKKIPADVVLDGDA